MNMLKVKLRKVLFLYLVVNEDWFARAVNLNLNKFNNYLITK